MTLHPDFPIVEGSYRMTRNWSVTLPGQFNRRIEDDDLVIWRSGLTLWIAVWGNDDDDPIAERYDWIKSDISDSAYDVEESADQGIRRLAYRLQEGAEDDRVAAFYCFAVGDSGQVQMAIYFDQESDVEIAKEIGNSLAETPE